MLDTVLDAENIVVNFLLSEFTACLGEKEKSLNRLLQL